MRPPLSVATAGLAGVLFAVDLGAWHYDGHTWTQVASGHGLPHRAVFSLLIELTFAPWIALRLNASRTAAWFALTSDPGPARRAVRTGPRWFGAAPELAPTSGVPGRMLDSTAKSLCRPQCRTSTGASKM